VKLHKGSQETSLFGRNSFVGPAGHVGLITVEEFTQQVKLRTCAACHEACTKC